MEVLHYSTLNKGNPIEIHGGGMVDFYPHALSYYTV